jgi:hypothetical protein
MRTRRSVRNQNILFRELFKPKEQPKVQAPIRTDAEIDAMYWISKSSRALMKRDAAKARANNPEKLGSASGSP